MASTLIVDQLQKTGGSTTALTLPTSNASASQYLQNDGAGALSWATVSIPAGGLTQASQWRLTTSFDNSAVLTTNLEEVDTAGYGRLGSAMTVDGSGVFTFPETGYWYINFVCTYDAETYSPNASGGSLSTSINTGGAWTQQTGEQGMTYLGYYNHSNSTFIFDVENTTTHLVRFAYTAQGATDTCIGSSTMNKTYMTFMKLAGT